MILVDTNVVIDVATADPHWGAWSLNQLESAAASDGVAINDVVYAELSAGYRHTDELDNTLRTLRIAHAIIPKFALFLAGHAFRQYRRRRGVKTGVLPDFFIGAHAFVENATLLTRDPDRVRAYFPTVTVIAP